MYLQLRGFGEQIVNLANLQTFIYLHILTNWGDLGNKWCFHEIFIKKLSVCVRVNFHEFHMISRKIIFLYLVLLNSLSFKTSHFDCTDEILWENLIFFLLSHDWWDFVSILVVNNFHSSLLWLIFTHFSKETLFFILTEEFLLMSSQFSYILWNDQINFRQIEYTSLKNYSKIYHYIKSLGAILISI